MERRDSARLTRREGRIFAFTLAGAFLALSAYSWWMDHELALRLFASIGSVMLALGLFLPGRLGPLHRAWMGFALLLSKITTPVFLGIVYYLVLTPTGLLLRLFGRNSVAVDSDVSTYWVRRADDGSREDMHRQF